MQDNSEIAALLAFSVRIGCNPLLVQASSGNVSLKTGSALWIKASGHWLAHVKADESFVLLDLARVQACLQRDIEFCGSVRGKRGNLVRASIETSMHAALPHRVVVHVHSLNTIAWAVRLDGQARLAERLAGLAWQWIPYVASGLPLARAILRARDLSPGANVFVLQNHGLVVCGDSSEEAEALLFEVERRVMISPRFAPPRDHTLDTEFSANAHWTLPRDQNVHACALDVVSNNILSAGILYPCQAVFLGSSILMIDPSGAAIAALKYACQCNCASFCVVRGRGVLVSREMSRAQCEVLTGLVGVVQRLDESAPLRYLQHWELDELQTPEAFQYRKCAEENFVTESCQEVEQSCV